MPKIVCVVPSIRDEQMVQFRASWKNLFEKHKVTLVTVWDGEVPQVETHDYDTGLSQFWSDPLGDTPCKGHRDLFCRFTDACRNIGFVYAATLKPDYVLTLDDDVAPCHVASRMERGIDNKERWFTDGIEGSPYNDPIQQHLDALDKRVPLDWTNTAHCGSPYLRGVPYSVRDQAPVMLSHGVWTGTPDFDGETQLKLETTTGVPTHLPYYVGPIPRGTLFPLCGMNVMVRLRALPYLYFAPMGKDTGIDGLNRFADIWMGVFLKREFDKLNWACYTGASVIHHTRASDARKNYEQEMLGREWNEQFWQVNEDFSSSWFTQTEQGRYYQSYAKKRAEYAELIRNLLDQKGDQK